MYTTYHTTEDRQGEWGHHVPSRAKVLTFARLGTADLGSKLRAELAGK